MSQQKFEALLQAVKAVMEEHKVPGVTLGVIDGDDAHTAGLGVTSADNPLDVNDETLFQIGSVTKTFTTTALMRLVEMGQIDRAESAINKASTDNLLVRLHLRRKNT